MHIAGKGKELTDAEVITKLRDVLGGRLVAFLAGVEDTKVIGLWAKGDEAPEPETFLRLFFTYNSIVKPLLEVESPESVKAWMENLNPMLDDVSPARALAEGNWVSWQRVQTAMRFFRSNG